MYQSTSGNSVNCSKQIDLINTFRKLWTQHIMWTRSFIISTASNLGDLQLVTKRLLRNPGDFANELRQFYGNDVAKKFEALFTDHLLIAARLVNHAKNGDMEDVKDDRKKWYENADEIADFLASINPYWSKREWQAMMYDHLKMTENEATKRLTSQYAADIAQYDDIENGALKMADSMANGITKQFNP